MKIIIPLLGILVVLFLMYLLSSKKKDIDYKLVVKGLIVQFIIAFLLIKFPAGKTAVSKTSDAVNAILNFGFEGLSFVFGSLANPGNSNGFIFIIHALGNIIFTTALVGALSYLGILGFVVKIIGGIVGKVLGTSQAESFVAVANMFLGHTDSPILVSRYLGDMTDSEIMVVLVSGMGSMSATIIAGYAALGIPMEYILIASALVPFGSMVVSKIVLPETEMNKLQGEVTIDRKGGHENIIAAITDGAVNGINVVIAVAASLVAFIGLVALINGILGVFGISLQQVLSYLFYPIGYLMGLEGKENILFAGELLGYKLVLNEFIAYDKLAQGIKALREGIVLDPRSTLILTVAMAGFANVGSMGICVSGISVLSPTKKPVLARLVLKGMLGGFAVSVLSSMIVATITAF